MSADNERPLTISLMPSEIIVMIACNLTPCSRAPLALTCKRFWNEIPRKIPRSTQLDGLGIPRELPSNFKEPTMSDPRLSQPERWQFLRLLERDNSDRWLLCFDCFILHPRYTFIKPKTTLVPWLKSCGGLLSPLDPPRSCRYLSQGPTSQGGGSALLSGLVDICPCCHLTPAKRDRIQASHNEFTQNGPHGSTGRYGHVCLQVYGDIELKISLTPFLYEEDGELGFRFQYTLTSPINSSSICPRMLCPHIPLDILIRTFSQCRELHSEKVVCAGCKGLKYCSECHMRVHWFDKVTESTSGMISYIVNLKRRLDKKLWNKHVIFPFARQRQYDLVQQRPSWKLW